MTAHEPLQGDLENLVRDFCILLRQHESAQTQVLVDLSEISGRLEALEARLIDPYSGSRAEQADRLKDLLDTGWKPDSGEE